jgi:hypothetical protein
MTKVGPEVKDETGRVVAVSFGMDQQQRGDWIGGIISGAYYIFVDQIILNFTVHPSSSAIHSRGT